MVQTTPLHGVGLTFQESIAGVVGDRPLSFV
jgi:hypothetical protein